MNTPLNFRGLFLLLSGTLALVCWMTLRFADHPFRGGETRDESVRSRREDGGCSSDLPERAQPSCVRAGSPEQVISGALTDTGRIEMIRECLRRDDLEGLHRVIIEMQEAHTPADISALLTLARDGRETPTCRKISLEILAELGDSAAISGLSDLCLDLSQEDWVRGEAAFTMARIFGPESPEASGSIQLLVGLISDGGAEVRRGALDAIGYLKLPVASGELTAALGDPIYEVRARAAWALSQLGGESAAVAIAERLRLEPDGAEFVDALGRIGSPIAVPALLEIVECDRVDTRRANAISALGQIADRRALPALITLLNGADEYLAMLSAQALAHIDSPDSKAALEAAARERSWADAYAASEVRRSLELIRKSR